MEETAHLNIFFTVLSCVKTTLKLLRLGIFMVFFLSLSIYFMQHVLLSVLRASSLCSMAIVEVLTAYLPGRRVEVKHCQESRNEALIFRLGGSLTGFFWQNLHV